MSINGTFEINAKTLQSNGFIHFPCSRERLGKPMAYYRVNSNDTVSIVVFDGSYSVYLLIEPRLLDKIKSYKMITALISHVSNNPFIKALLVNDNSYVQYFNFNNISVPASVSVGPATPLRVGSMGSFMHGCLKKFS